MCPDSFSKVCAFRGPMHDFIGRFSSSGEILLADAESMQNYFSLTLSHRGNDFLLD